MSRILPILFNTEMVQANLDDCKTATRRLIKPRYQGNECSFQVVTNKATGERRIDTVDADGYVCRTGIKPHYQPGDILYARETWAFQCCIECMNAYEDESCMIGKTSTIHEDKDAISEGCYIYRADHPTPERIIWRPSIHMPKAAARIWRRVTEIKIQRLQEMTLDDFIKEGVFPEGPEECNCAWKHSGCPESSCTNRVAYLQERYRFPFSHLWDSTIPKEQRDIYGWAANPWVWVIEYERCEKPEVQDV